MNASHTDAFDIDVNIAPLLEVDSRELLIDADWYLLSRRREGRTEQVQAKLDRTFQKAMWRAQWQATARFRQERRRAVRVPLLSRVHVDGSRHMLTTDISLSGLRCSGRPQSGVLDIEFKIPGLPFPVDARAEVVSFKEANVIPLVGMRFVSLDRAYLEHIADYIHRRRARSLAA